jgi:hypothetical protein
VLKLWDVSPTTLYLSGFLALGLLALLSARKRANTLRDYVAAQGWTYLGTSNPVPDEEWKTFCQDQAALLFGLVRCARESQARLRSSVGTRMSKRFASAGGRRQDCAVCTLPQTLAVL